MRGIYDSTLAEAFGFDENDLAANRQLQLSPNQRERLRVGAKVARGHVPKVIVILAIGLVVTAVFAGTQARGDTKQLWLGAAAAVPILVVIGFLLRRNYKVADRFEAGAVAVQRVEGQVHIDQPTYKLSSSIDRYLLYRSVFIGDMEFVLLPEHASAFEEGAAYRLYWADYWNNKVPAIISGERLAP